MKITITRNEEEFNNLAAWRVITQILEKQNAVIGLSTGDTTVDMHEIISNIYNENPFPTSGITFFNVDELINIPRDYPGSCYSRIVQQLVGPLEIPEDNFIMPPTLSIDDEWECLLFEQRLAERGGVDLQVLGIGTNGHIGINHPGTPFESETWVTPIDVNQQERIRKEIIISPDVEIHGLTRGIKNIMHSRKLILLAKGLHKAKIIKEALTGPITTDIPASILQLHPHCEVLLDADAGSEIAEYAKQHGYNF